jgi:putative MATE family efflux protein
MLVSAVLTVLSLIFVRPILQLMQTPESIIHMSQSFISMLFAGIFATVLFNILSNVIRALGDSRTPLFFLIIASVINIVLDLLFILVFHMGVGGAGLATVTAQLLSAVFCIIYIYKKMPSLQLSKNDFRLVTKEDLKKHANIAFPMAFQMSIIAIGAVVLQIAINTIGTEAVAANTAAGRIDQFATLPMMSFGVTMATYTAQNYGAKKYDRIIKGVKQGLLLSCSFAVIAGLIVIVFGQNIAQLFISGSDPKVFELVQTYFNINASMYWLLAILFILRYTLQGLGKTAVPTIAGFMELIMRVVAAIVLTKFFGYAGAVSANPLAWFGACAVLITSYISSMKYLKGKAEESKLMEETSK